MQENLNEIFANKNERPADRMDKEEEVPDMTNDESSPGQESAVMEKSKTDSEPQQNNQPVTEAGVINSINGLNVKLGKITIITYWQIGGVINNFYHGTYGTNELGKISAATGIGRDTLAKACRFAKQYSREQVEMLLKGSFVMSWYQITHNLTIEPQKVLETYQQSSDQKQFYDDIIKLKSSSEARGKLKPPKTIEVTLELNDAGEMMVIDATEIANEEPITAEYYDLADQGESKAIRTAEGQENEPMIIDVPEMAPVESIATDYYEPAGSVDPDEWMKQNEEYIKELEELKQENERLKKEISLRDAEVAGFRKYVTSLEREIDRNRQCLNASTDRWERIKRELQKDTPNSVIIEWIDTGNEETLKVMREYNFNEKWCM